MSDVPQKTLIEKSKDLIPFFTSMLMIAGISFTYYTYFFDVHKTPQIIIENTMNKIDETERYYIIKINIKVKNQSKSRVEIIANQSKLYALRCRLFDNKTGDVNFMTKILDSLDISETDSEINNIDINKYMECSDKELVGYYQPMINTAWFLPEETAMCEFISAVPKTFDVANLETKVHFALSEEELFPIYQKDSLGDINYKIYVIDDKDTSKKHELNMENEEDKKLVIKNTVIDLIVNSQLWLSGNNAIKNSNKKFSQDTLSLNRQEK